MVRGVARAQGRKSKTCFMLLRVNLNHDPRGEKAYVLEYCISECCRIIHMFICCRTICHHIYKKTYIDVYIHIYTHAYVFIYINMKKHKDFSGAIFALVLACLAVVLLSFAFPSTHQNETGSKKACLSNSRSVEAFINPVR